LKIQSIMTERSDQVSHRRKKNERLVSGVGESKGVGGLGGKKTHYGEAKQRATDNNKNNKG